MAYPFRDGEPPEQMMWATWLLIGLCLWTFAFLQPKPMQGFTSGLTIASNASAQMQVRAFVDEHALVPCEVTHGKSMHAGAACDGYPSDHPENYQPKNPYIPLIGALFLHGNLTHLFGNLLFLWLFGRGVEQRLGAIGVFALYLAGGIAASLGYVALHAESTDPVLGASGAIAALMGAYLVLQARRRILAVVFSAGLQVVYLPAWAILAFYFLEQFFVDPASRVAWEAHVAGMLFGIVVALVIARRDRRSDTTRASERPRDSGRATEGFHDGPVIHPPLAAPPLAPPR